MKKSLIILFCLVFLTVVNASSERRINNETFVVCEPLESVSGTHLMQCELIEVSSLKSIDKWIATIPA